MTLPQALDMIVAAIIAMDAKVSGDDSPLPNPWEEMKDQLQHGLSPDWPAYLLTLRQFVSGFVRSLDQAALDAVARSLKCTSAEAVERKMMQRLLARGKKEKIQYAPFDFEYFCYPLLGFVVYGCVMERTGVSRCSIRAYSAAAPFGEQGTIDTSQIDRILTPEQFENAQRRGWPERLPG